MTANGLTSEDRSFKTKQSWSKRRFVDAHGREPDDDELEVQMRTDYPELFGETGEAPVTATAPVVPTASAPSSTPTESKAVTKTIHFLKDGFTALSQVWYYGQELTLRTDETRYKETCDTTGKSFMDFTEEEQIERFGEVVLGQGPWKGVSHEEAIRLYQEAEAMGDEEERKRATKKLQRAGIVRPPANAPLAGRNV